jgi:regulator of replication initiation timing
MTERKGAGETPGKKDKGSAKMPAPAEKHLEAAEVFNESEEIMTQFNRGKRFIEELLRENERLRYKILHLEQDLAGIQTAEEPVVDKEEENRRLREHLASINSRFDALKKENEDFRRRSQEVESQNENLLNLYVSGYQLHSTLRRDDVLQVIKEILLNLVGAEVFALWLVDQETGLPRVRVLWDEIGFLGGKAPALPDDILAEMVLGQPRYNAEPGQIEGTVQEPLAAVPFTLEGKTHGFLVVYKLLVQKKSGLTSLDFDLLGLLTAQAAGTLIGAMLYEDRATDLRWLARHPGKGTP